MSDAEQSDSTQEAPEPIIVVNHANVYEAMAAAMQECGYVQKKQSTGLKYAFAGESDMIEEIRPVMVKHGLFIFPSKVVDLRVDTYTTSGGSLMNLVTVTQQYTIAHESGTFLIAEVVGAGADVGDKATPKANTGAFKYALRQSFTIETGDDPDNTPSDQQERKPPTQGGRRGGGRRAPAEDPIDGLSQAINAVQMQIRDGKAGLGAVIQILNAGEAVAQGEANAWWKANARARLGVWLDAAEPDETTEARINKLINRAAELRKVPEQ